jgi:hypothetical protein
MNTHQHNIHRDSPPSSNTRIEKGKGQGSSGSHQCSMAVSMFH